MAPRTRFILTLIGLGLVALPLVKLTQHNEQEHEETQYTKQAAQNLRTLLTLRFTGKPTEIELLYEDTVWLHTKQIATSPIELEVNLPHDIKYADIEAKISWEPGSPENAVTLTLEPQGLVTRSETQWTGNDTQHLHTIFSYAW